MPEDGRTHAGKGLNAVRRLNSDDAGDTVVKKHSPARPVTADGLLKGSSGPGGTRIRLARPGDSGQVTRLLELVDLPLDPAVGAVIEAGTVASTLLLGLDHGADAMLHPLGEAVAADRPEDAMPGLIWVLVAESWDGSLDSVLLAVPPANVLVDGIAGGVPVPAVTAGAARIAKLRAVAVAEDARGNGLGETLIKRTVRTYRQLGFRLIYGQFSVGSGLEAYYARQGFTVLDEGEVIDLRRMNLPIIIRSDPSDPERLFVRWQ
jgi:GNAT superfamily N-acetyltransferase